MSVTLTNARLSLQMQEAMGPVVTMLEEMEASRQALEAAQRKTKDALIDEIEQLSQQKLDLIAQNKTLQADIDLTLHQIADLKKINPELKAATIKAIDNLKEEIRIVRTQIDAVIARRKAILARQANQMYENHYVHTQWLTDKLQGKAV